MNRIILSLEIVLLALLVGCRTIVNENTDQKLDLAVYINPFIGASTSTGAAGIYYGLGKTFPGAVVPFVMVQVSPNLNMKTSIEIQNEMSHENKYLQTSLIKKMVSFMRYHIL